MPLVSVIIPCFNQGRYLRAAVDSALAQTHGEVEVIVVDDGSTDDTREVVESYAHDARVRYLHQANRGPAAARNAGMASCRGQYVNFLDADDLLLPEKLASQIEALEADPEIAFVYCDVECIDDDGKRAPDDRQATVAESRRVLSGDIFESLFVGGYFPPHVALVRRSVLDKVGGLDEDLRGCCDWDLWLRIAADGGQAYFQNRTLARYRLHAANMSSDTRHMRDDEIRVVQKLIARYPARLAPAYFALRDKCDEMHVANKWLGDYVQNELVEMRKRITALDGCPKFVRYPIYAVLLAIGKSCTALRRVVGR